jgi:UTP--glucose-1-phosphate uridylyltransferase
MLRIILEETLRAGIEEICLVIAPGDAAAYSDAAGDLATRLRFVEQSEPRGYGHAVLCARGFVGDQPFLHLVGDHLYLSGTSRGCAQQLVEVAQTEACAVSAVQPTRESLLPYYGAIGGRRMSGTQELYVVERVLEKPTPTAAEQELIVPGLRAGHYLCFFGMHVLLPTIMDVLERQISEAGDRAVALAPALDLLATRERYLALANLGRRYDVGTKYGLLTAQMALALDGADREEVLAQLVELLALRK